LSALWCATTNPGKLREFQAALHSTFDVRTVPRLDRVPPAPETGATFEENAAQKALYYASRAPGPVFVDDSGLEVDALGGAPGVYSARFAGPEADDGKNNHLLLERMAGIENRAARFVCVVALAESDRLIQTFRAEVEGRLLTEPRGNHGFGYDPLFFYPPLNATFAEITFAQKMRVSHRSRALAAMRKWLTTHK
jgi:XTP/dITP diphosphohydrolase